MDFSLLRSSDEFDDVNLADISVNEPYIDLPRSHDMFSHGPIPVHHSLAPMPGLSLYNPVNSEARRLSPSQEQIPPHVIRFQASNSPIPSSCSSSGSSNSSGLSSLGNSPVPMKFYPMETRFQHSEPAAIPQLVPTNIHSVIPPSAATTPSPNHSQTQAPGQYPLHYHNQASGVYQNQPYIHPTMNPSAEMSIHHNENTFHQQHMTQMQGRPGMPLDVHQPQFYPYQQFPLHHPQPLSVASAQHLHFQGQSSHHTSPSLLSSKSSQFSSMHMPVNPPSPQSLPTTNETATVPVTRPTRQKKASKVAAAAAPTAATTATNVSRKRAREQSDDDDDDDDTSSQGSKPRVENGDTQNTSSSSSDISCPNSEVNLDILGEHLHEDDESLRKSCISLGLHFPADFPIADLRALIQERHLRNQRLARKAALARQARLKKKSKLEYFQECVNDMRESLEKAELASNAKNVIIRNLREENAKLTKLLEERSQNSPASSKGPSPPLSPSVSVIGDKKTSSANITNMDPILSKVLDLQKFLNVFLETSSDSNMVSILAGKTSIEM